MMSRRCVQGAPCRSVKGSFLEAITSTVCERLYKWSRTSTGAVWHRRGEAMTEEFKVEEGLQGEAPLVHCSDGQADR